MSVELQFATTDEIVDELQRRYLSLVLITLETAKGKVNEQDEVMSSWYRGGWNACYGLVRRQAARMEAEDAKRFEHVNTDDQDGDEDSADEGES